MMEVLAHAFDQPIESQEHQELASSAWMGGELIVVRYWLGRLLRRNFFREFDDVVKQALQDYLVKIGCNKGSPSAFDYQAWLPIATLLRQQVETEEGCAPTKNARLVAAIQAVLTDPELNDSELAAVAKTTAKQIARMSEVSVLRKSWRLQTKSKSTRPAMPFQSVPRAPLW
jgi:hypothetical protein